GEVQIHCGVSRDFVDCDCRGREARQAARSVPGAACAAPGLMLPRYSESGLTADSSSAAAKSSGTSASIACSVRRTVGPATLTTPVTRPECGSRTVAAIDDIPGAQVSIARL